MNRFHMAEDWSPQILADLGSQPQIYGSRDLALEDYVTHLILFDL